MPNSMDAAPKSSCNKCHQPSEPIKCIVEMIPSGIKIDAKYRCNNKDCDMKTYPFSQYIQDGDLE